MTKNLNVKHKKKKKIILITTKEIQLHLFRVKNKLK